MVWEANLIEWLQTSLSGAAGFAKYFDFFGAETGLLILVLVVMTTALSSLASRRARVPSRPPGLGLLSCNK